MLDEMRLVEVKTENFSAVVPPFENCDYDEALKILYFYHADDKQGAFDQALRMFLSVLAEGKIDDLKTIPDQEIVTVVTNWMTIR